MSAKHNNLKEYEVEKVVDHRYRKTAFPDGSHDEYLIKWKHYPSSQNTWEPESHLNSLALAEARRLKSSDPPPRKKRNLTKCIDDIAELSVDEVAIVFSFLPPKDIMRARVCKTWRDAAKKTIVPPTYSVDHRVSSYDAMRAMSTALPRLQLLTIDFGDASRSRSKFTDGDDPNEEQAARTSTYHAYDINIISNFSKLRILEIESAPLNGRYPALFNFPLLEELTIYDGHYLKWDLEMLSGCPRLRYLFCSTEDYPTGNLSSLGVLKNILEEVVLVSHNIQGNLMDIADFPHLKELDLNFTAVTGDIRDIRPDNFPALERLRLPKSVVGGIGHEFQRISDVPVFMQSIHHFLQRNPTIFEQDDDESLNYTWSLSQDSPDWYNQDWGGDDPPPPFHVDFIKAGPRRGWAWYGENIKYGPWLEEVERSYCEVNWLDPEPSSGSSEYKAYIEELQKVEERIGRLYRGYHAPPNEEQYRRICYAYHYDRWRNVS